MNKLWLIPMAIVGVLFFTGCMNYLMRWARMTIRVYWQTSALKKRYEEWRKQHYHEIAKFKRGVRAWKYSHWPFRPLFHR